MTNPWNATDYDERFGFVTSGGRELVDELAAGPGDRVLDIGCGTGHLTAAIAATGASTVGIDADEAMIARARELHPQLSWLRRDAQDSGDMTVDDPELGGQFDAAVSNAALHWMPRQAEVLGNVRGLLRPGAPFVAEMGGQHNIEAVDAALRTSLRECGLEVDVPDNFFPSVAVQAALLEDAGFRIDAMRWFRRPTLLDDGQTVVDWVKHFRAGAWERVPVGMRAELAERILAHGRRDGLLTPTGWQMDYCRLRFAATAS